VCDAAALRMSAGSTHAVKGRCGFAERRRHAVGDGGLRVYVTPTGEGALDGLGVGTAWKRAWRGTGLERKD
jgi:hypothetical protein